MGERFAVEFSYKGIAYNIEAKFVRLGYIHQFHVIVNDEQLIIEFDEDREYRVINPAGISSGTIDAGFLRALVEKISSLH